MVNVRDDIEEAIVLVDYRANRSLDVCTDYLFNNEYLDVHEIKPKYLRNCEDENRDLVLIYKNSHRNKFYDR